MVNEQHWQQLVQKSGKMGVRPADLVRLAVALHYDNPANTDMYLTKKADLQQAKDPNRKF